MLQAEGFATGMGDIRDFGISKAFKISGEISDFALGFWRISDFRSGFQATCRDFGLHAEISDFVVGFHRFLKRFHRGFGVNRGIFYRFHDSALA